LRFLNTAFQAATDCAHTAYRGGRGCPGHDKYAQHVCLAIGDSDGDVSIERDGRRNRLANDGLYVAGGQVAGGDRRYKRNRRTRRWHCAWVIRKATPNMAHRQTNTITRNSAITDSHQYVAQVIHAAGQSNHQRHCPGLIGHVAKKLDRQLVNVMYGILSFNS